MRHYIHFEPQAPSVMKDTGGDPYGKPLPQELLGDDGLPNLRPGTASLRWEIKVNAAAFMASLGLLAPPWPVDPNAPKVAP